MDIHVKLLSLAAFLPFGLLAADTAPISGQQNGKYGPDIKYERSIDPSNGQDLSSVVAGYHGDQFGPSWTCWWHGHLDAAIDIRDISTGIPERVTSASGLPKLAWRFDSGQWSDPTELKMEIKGVTYYLPNDKRVPFTESALVADSLELRLFTPEGEPIHNAQYDLSGLQQALSRLQCFSSSERRSPALGGPAGCTLHR